MTKSNDDDRFNRLYEANRDRGVAFAARFTNETLKFPSLVGLGAEDIYQDALQKYYVDGAYREEQDDDWRLLRYRITQAGLDAQKKAQRLKRVPPGPLTRMDETDKDGEPRTDLTRPGRTEVDRLLDKVAISDARTKATIAADANAVDATAVEAAYAYYAENQTYQEIAGDHGFSEETARRRVKRGLQLLTDQLQPDNCRRKDSP